MESCVGREDLFVLNCFISEGIQFCRSMVVTIIEALEHLWIEVGFGFGLQVALDVERGELVWRVSGRLLGGAAYMVIWQFWMM